MLANDQYIKIWNCHLSDHALEKLTAATIIDAAQEQVLGLQWFDF